MRPRQGVGSTEAALAAASSSLNDPLLNAHTSENPIRLLDEVPRCVKLDNLRRINFSKVCAELTLRVLMYLSLVQCNQAIVIDDGSQPMSN